MITVHSTEIHFVSPSQQAVSVDAVVEEQDTYLLLGTYPVIGETMENYPALIRNMERQKPLYPGQVLVRYTSPIQFTAINYDIEQNPICHEKWLVSSLKNIFTECRQQKITSVIMPLPGIKYGKLSAETAMNILKNTLLDEKTEFPREIYIVHEQ